MMAARTPHEAAAKMESELTRRAGTCRRVRLSVSEQRSPALHYLGRAGRRRRSASFIFADFPIDPDSFDEATISLQFRLPSTAKH
jgi:hypothetical protein